LNGRVLLGVLTPSSNTRLEPLTAQLLGDLPEVTAHFARFRVTDVSLAASALAQFNTELILEAAAMLADARVDAIVWSGTSAGWLGLESDYRLCELITKQTAIPATTSTLALLEALRLMPVDRIGLVSPYPKQMQDAIIATLAGEGITAIGAAPLGIRSNWDLSEVSRQTLTDQVAEVAAQGVPAITTFCTNLPAAPLVPDWERIHCVPVFDTVSTAVWGALRLAGVHPSRVVGWGELFHLG
jgi:maleate isomerase